MDILSVYFLRWGLKNIMLDQSFSAENFRIIFDYENRKGNYLEREFFPAIEDITKEIKTVSAKIREHRKTKSETSIDTYEEEKERLNKEKNELKENKEILLLEELEEIARDIAKEDFLTDLKEIDVGKDKKAYRFTKSTDPANSAASYPATYFALKQLQNNLRKLYKVKQGNRHNIVCQLRETLSDKLPKHIIRTDISSFYESIPRERLIKKLNDDPLLTLTSKTMILRILQKYKDISGEKSGLPRGVGISAYLSELYLRKFDEIILKCPQVLYYARFVDDIIIVCTADRNICIRRKWEFVEKSLRDIGLTLNRKKTFIKNINGKTKREKIDYLGYKFTFGDDSVDISLTDSKIKKYKNRLVLSFDDYLKTAKRNNNKAKSLLLKRIRFLTGNTRLVNNKKNAVVGIYFSYSLISKPYCLGCLDCFLRENINKIEDENLKNTLLELSFKKGFEEKRFFKFSAKDFKNIVKVWKYAPEKN